MQAINFFVRYGWIALLAVCLVSFIPLALSADVVGGIPAWAYWTLGKFLTLGLVAWAVIATVVSWRRSKGASLA